MIGARVTGIPELKAALAGLVPKLRVRALRNALAAGARLVQREARRFTPVINPASLAVRKGYRKPGTVQKAISVRTSKLASRKGDVGVFVNVRPAKGSIYRNGVQIRAKQRGAKSPNDPYYWRWLEFGRQARGGEAARSRVVRVKKLGIKGVRARRALRAVGAMRAFGFLQKAAKRLPDALQIFIKTIGPQIQRLNKPKAPAP